MSTEEQKSLEQSESTALNGYAELTATIRELVAVMREGGIGRLDVKRGDLRISLSTQDIQAAPSASPQVIVSNHTSTDDETRPATSGVNEYIITSPMIGTYYAAPAPGERPYVTVGDTVEVGQTVAIIEAMKIMNEIVSEQAGVVEEILVSNGEAIEYGHPLMRIRVEG